MEKQQTLFDREGEQAAHNRENAAREQEELKRQNDQLLTQITTLQNTQGSPPPSPERLITTRTQDGSTLRVGGTAEQPPLLLQNNLMAGRVRLVLAREISTITLRGREVRPCPRSGQACTEAGGSKKQECCITADSEPSPLMHLTPPSPRAYWNMNFPRSSRF